MKVTLISATQAFPIEGKVLTPEELIVYIARVSNPGNQMNSETAPKLLAYLIRKQHWSPFEMVDLTFELYTSRAIAAQILRHKSFSFQEFSQRYAKVEAMEPIQLRYQADKNRQSSTTEIKDTDLELYDEVNESIAAAQRLYNKLIDRGIAKECARFILPLTTQTRLYMKGSVRSWLHYLKLRTAEETQLEHREPAIEFQKIFDGMFPNIAESVRLIQQ